MFDVPVRPEQLRVAPQQMHPVIQRLKNSAVVWSWGLNFLRFGSGFLLLPLLLQLPTEDFGLYWVLLGLQAIVPLLDLGFLTSIDRAVGYAMGGAEDFQQQGAPQSATLDAPPNYALLWRLLHVTRSLYRWLAIFVLVGLGAWGTYVVGLRVHETSDSAQAWLAWGVTLAACVFEMYAGWWSVYLRSLNKVLLYSQILMLGLSIKFVLSGLLLLANAGLLAVPIAAFISGVVARSVARRRCLEFFAGQPQLVPSNAEVRATIKTLWPNSWRMALHYLSGYLNSSANSFVCLMVLGLAANATYGLSVQIVIMCQGMASVWVQVKWPLFSQLRARQDLTVLRDALRHRLWLAGTTYVVLALLALLLHEPLLRWLHSGKAVLPSPWFQVLLLNGLFEMHSSILSTLLLTANRAPFLVPGLITSCSSLSLTIGLIHYAGLGSGALVVGPLLAGCAFNYWYWPREGARSVETSWARLLFSHAKGSP